MINNKSLIFSSIFLILLASFASASTPGDIDRCQVLDTAGTYTLSQDITLQLPGYLYTSEQATCFIISTDNVVLDGNGYTINGNNSMDTTGIKALNVKNIVLKDLKITNFTYQIVFDSVSNSLIEDNVIDAMNLGIRMINSNNNMIQSNSLSLNGKKTGDSRYLAWFTSGINLQGSSNNIFNSNEITLVGEKNVGIQLSSDSLGNTINEDNILVINGNTLTIDYSTTAPTNEPVVVTLTSSKPITITNNGGLDSYTFTENGVFAFEITDPAGNTSIVTTSVNNIDKVAPTITLLGSSLIYVEFGSVYTDAGATASDIVDGDLTSSIVPSGIVNTNILGTYTINYDATDSAGNPATQVTRIVNIIPFEISIDDKATLENTWFTMGSALNFAITGNYSLNLINFLKIDSVLQLISSTITGKTADIVSTIGNLADGTHNLEINAKDVNGNFASDTATIKVDRTAPTMNVVSMCGGATCGLIITSELNAVDSGIGIDSSSVQGRIWYFNTLGQWVGGIWTTAIKNGETGYYDVTIADPNFHGGGWAFEAKSCDLLSSINSVEHCTSI